MIAGTGAALARASVALAALYVAAQLVRWEPVLAIPLAVVILATVAARLIRRYQAAVAAERDLDEAAAKAAGTVVGPAAIRDEYQLVQREARR